MTFTVTYRAKDGALRDERIEAASRAECVAECRRRGIAPTGIREGKSGISGKSGKLWFAIGAALVIVVGGAWWWMAREGEPKTASVQQQGAKPRAEKPPAEMPKTASVQQQGAEKPVAAATNAPGAAAAKAPAAKDEVVWREATTNSNGVVTERYRTADGKSHRVIRHPKRVFDNASDQLIAMAISASKNGGSMPPLPLTDATEKDFLDSLTRPIEIADDDPPDVKELKRDVAAVREQLIDMVKGGMTVRQSLIEHQKAVNDNAEFRGEALKALSEFRKEGDRESAEEFRKRVNEEFEKRGMSPVETRRKKQ